MGYATRTVKKVAVSGFVRLFSFASPSGCVGPMHAISCDFGPDDKLVVKMDCRCTLVARGIHLKKMKVMTAGQTKNVW